MNKKEETHDYNKAFHAIDGKTVDIFVYGTLMNKDHLKLLINREAETEEGMLRNYMHIAPDDGGFNFLVKQSGAITKGVILKNISRDELKRLDAFEAEGSLYHRTKVIIRCGHHRQRCFAYIGDISALGKTFHKEMKFDERYRYFIEKTIDDAIEKIPTDRPDIEKRVLHELMSSAVDEIIESHFDGNYICNYIMIQALEEVKPPKLKKILQFDDLKPYAPNYMRLVCQHIILNQLVDKISKHFPKAVRVSQHYFRHGLAMLKAFMFYNLKKTQIDSLISKYQLDQIVEGQSYRDYAKISIQISDEVYDRDCVLAIIDEIEKNWYSTPTPIGAELEFSCLGHNTIDSKPGEDKLYDGFYWFKDFDLFNRTWRLGGHVDSHRHITVGQKRHRGFLEYALGRYQILGDLSRPLFDSPWGMSRLINEVVDFINIPPHSLHISMELNSNHKNIRDVKHKDENLACLMMLGGDFGYDTDGVFREFRLFNKELQTREKTFLNFSDRKYHFSRPNQNPEDASDVMEYKFSRLNKERTDYGVHITALKGYQFATHARPICSKAINERMPEQIFLDQWGRTPESIDTFAINKFLNTIEKGMIEEHKIYNLKPWMQDNIIKIEKKLHKINNQILHAKKEAK